MEIIDRPSPNCNTRRDGAVPDMVVLHYTAMEEAESLDRLCDPQAEVSAHYVIGRQGKLWRLVAEEARAWHAGAGAWGTVEDVNSHSIGIELVNRGGEPFPELQMAALEDLLRGVMARWRISPERVIAHSDMAPRRKFDPGPNFDWKRLALSGLSVWPREGDAVEDFADTARQFGYRGDKDMILEAFRLRFRPWASGPVCAEDARVMASLAARWPCLDGAGV